MASVSEVAVKPIVLLIVLPVVVDSPLEDELGQDEIDFVLVNTS